VFVGLGGGQGAGRIQLDQIIFEHTFNIKGRADIDSTIRHSATDGQHLTDPDNTSPIRTTPAPEWTGDVLAPGSGACDA
jgi:hypothetical protein